MLTFFYFSCVSERQIVQGLPPLIDDTPAPAVALYQGEERNECAPPQSFEEVPTKIVYYNRVTFEFNIEPYI